jgi:hypothetical protein
MTPAERQQMMDIAELAVNRYFDRYLSDVFPEQLDRMFKQHDSDVGAHPVQFKTLSATKRKVDRAMWMVAGVSALIAILVTLASLVSQARTLLP